MQNAKGALLSVPAGCTHALVEDYEPRPLDGFGGGGGSGKRNGPGLEPASMKAPSECERRKTTVLYLSTVCLILLFVLREEGVDWRMSSATRPRVLILRTDPA